MTAETVAIAVVTRRAKCAVLVRPYCIFIHPTLQHLFIQYTASIHLTHKSIHFLYLHGLSRGLFAWVVPWSLCSISRAYGLGMQPASLSGSQPKDTECNHTRGRYETAESQTLGGSLLGSSTHLQVCVVLKDIVVVGLPFSAERSSVSNGNAASSHRMHTHVSIIPHAHACHVMLLRNAGQRTWTHR